MASAAEDANMGGADDGPVPTPVEPQVVTVPAIICMEVTRGPPNDDETREGLLDALVTEMGVDTDKVTMCMHDHSDVPGREECTSATIRFATAEHEKTAGALLMLNDTGAALARGEGCTRARADVRVQSGTKHGVGVLWVVLSKDKKMRAEVMIYPAAKAEEMVDAFKAVGAKEAAAPARNEVEVEVADVTHVGFTLHMLVRTIGKGFPPPEEPDRRKAAMARIQGALRAAFSDMHPALVKRDAYLLPASKRMRKAVGGGMVVTLTVQKRREDRLLMRRTQPAGKISACWIGLPLLNGAGAEVIHWSTVNGADGRWDIDVPGVHECFEGLTLDHAGGKECAYQLCRRIGKGSGKVREYKPVYDTMMDDAREAYGEDDACAYMCAQSIRNFAYGLSAGGPWYSTCAPWGGCRGTLESCKNLKGVKLDDTYVASILSATRELDAGDEKVGLKIGGPHGGYTFTGGSGGKGGGGAYGGHGGKGGGKGGKGGGKGGGGGYGHGYYGTGGGGGHGHGYGKRHGGDGYRGKGGGRGWSGGVGAGGSTDRMPTADEEKRARAEAHAAKEAEEARKKEARKEKVRAKAARAAEAEAASAAAGDLAQEVDRMEQHASTLGELGGGGGDQLDDRARSLVEEIEEGEAMEGEDEPPPPPEEEEEEPPPPTAGEAAATAEEGAQAAGGATADGEAAGGGGAAAETAAGAAPAGEDDPLLDFGGDECDEVDYEESEEEDEAVRDDTDREERRAGKSSRNVTPMRAESTAKATAPREMEGGE